jgi:hypothetical protein
MANDVIDLAIFNEPEATISADFVVEHVETFFEVALQMLAKLRSAIDNLICVDQIVEVLEHVHPRKES